MVFEMLPESQENLGMWGVKIESGKIKKNYIISHSKYQKYSQTASVTGVAISFLWFLNWDITKVGIASPKLLLQITQKTTNQHDKSDKRPNAFLSTQFKSPNIC